MPFPEYFEITADEFKDLDDYIYSKQWHCYINDQKEITDQKGNPFSSFSMQTDVSIGRELMVDFKAKETRHMAINSENPFAENIKTITITGLNVDFKKEADYNALREDEKQIYIEDDNSNYALKIDIKTKKVIAIREQGLPNLKTVFLIVPIFGEDYINSDTGIEINSNFGNEQIAPFILADSFL